MAWETPLVMDNGSGICKAGFAGDHAPTVVFPSKVGRPRPSFVNDPDLKLRDSYVGDEAHSNRLLLSVKHPVQQGMITNWDDMEKLWGHTFKELDVFQDEHPILLTDVPNNPEVNREKMAQIMFETFKSPAIYIAIQGVLSLYAYGLVTGVAVDCGAQVSQIVPTIEGFSISNAMGCLDLGGQDLNLYLMKILGENGFTFTMQHCIEDVCEMKEKFCYVALDFDEEIQKTAAVGTTYELPDKQVITIGSEQFRCPEAFFQPHILGKESDGIHKACYDNIIKCDESEEVIKELFGNVVLSGGSSMFPGFPERMQKELASLVPSNTNLNVLAVPNRKHNVWIGGSIIASQSAFKEMWLTKEEYEESGPSIIHKKCV